MPDKGRGWYGDEERHREAAKQANQGRVGAALHTLMMLVTVPVSLIRTGGRVLVAQLTATARRSRVFLGYITLDRLLPSGIAGAIQEVIELTPKALGVRNTPRTKQFSAAVILGILAYFATFLTGGLLIGVAVFLTVMVLVAIARNVPAIDSGWSEWTAALGLKNDYDLPGWRRD